MVEARNCCFERVYSTKDRFPFVGADVLVFDLKSSTVDFGSLSRSEKTQPSLQAAYMYNIEFGGFVLLLLTRSWTVHVSTESKEQRLLFRRQSRNGR